MGRQYRISLNTLRRIVMGLQSLTNWLTEEDQKPIRQSTNDELLKQREEMLSEIRETSRHGPWDIFKASAIGGLLAGGLHAITFPIERALGGAAKTFGAHMKSPLGLIMLGTGVVGAGMSESIAQTLTKDYDRVNDIDQALATRGLTVTKTLDASGHTSANLLKTSEISSKVSGVQHEGKLQASPSRAIS